MGGGWFAGQPFTFATTKTETVPTIAGYQSDPNTGQPYPTDFARPPDVVEADVCVATGKRPTSPGAKTRKELVVKGREPQQPCDELTPQENEELYFALRSVTRDAAKYAPGAVQTVREYAAASRNFKTPVFGPTPPPPKRR